MSSQEPKIVPTVWPTFEEVAARVRAIQLAHPCARDAAILIEGEENCRVIAWRLLRRTEVGVRADVNDILDRFEMRQVAYAAGKPRQVSLPPRVETDSVKLAPPAALAMIADIEYAAIELGYLEALALRSALRGHATVDVLEAVCRIWLRIPR